MKKSAVFAGSIVILAAAYTGLAWYVGKEAETTIRTAVEQANQRIGKMLGPDAALAAPVLQIQGYQRGVFSSQARYSFTLDENGERVEFSLQDHMQHGPFPWDLLKQGSFTPLLAYSRSQLIDTENVKRWFDAARGAMPLKTDTRIGFGGSGTTLWEFSPLEWAHDGDRLSFSGGRMQVRFSKQLRDSEGEGEFASLVVGHSQGGETVSLNDIRLDSRSTTAADDTVQMNSTLQVSEIVIDDMASERLTLEQVSVLLESSQKAALLDGALRYDVQRVRVGEIDLGSLSIGGKVARLDFEALSALLSEYDAIAREHGVEGDEEFDLTPEDEARLLARVVPVLASSPELALQPVIWRNEQGESSLSFAARLQPLGEQGGAPAQQDALAGSLREIRFELALSRPMLLQVISRAAGGAEEGRQFEMLAAMMFDAYVSRLAEQGVVRREGERALSTVVYRDGEVDMNGHALSVAEFMALLEDLGL